MADGIEVRIDGLDEMLAELKQLPAVLQQRILRGAAATGASVIRKEAIARAPEMDEEAQQGHPPRGTLKRAIYQARIPERCTPAQETFRVGIRAGKRFRSVGKKGTNQDAFYATWVEFGHYARVSKGTTRDQKKAARALGVAKWIPARPFFRPAVATKRQAAIEAMRDYIARELPLAAQALVFFKGK